MIEWLATPEGQAIACGIASLIGSVLGVLVAMRRA